MPTRIASRPSLEPAVVALDRALHRRRAGQRVGRARVRHHHRVADRLDLGAAGRRDRFAQASEVLAPQLVGRGVAESDASSVEPTRSVNRIVTSPPLATFTSPISTGNARRTAPRSPPTTCPRPVELPVACHEAPRLRL